MREFPFFPQYDSMDCGPACLQMIAAYHGKNISLQELRNSSYIDKEGVSLQGISEAAESIGFRSLGVKIPFSDEKDRPSLITAPLPAIAHWNQNHFIVVIRVSSKYAWIADPASGKHKLNIAEFRKHWMLDQDIGTILLLEPTIFFTKENISNRGIKYIPFFRTYVKPYKKQFALIIIGLLLSIIFQLILPYLTQSIVDIGINNQNINFIYLMLLGQLMIFGGQITVRFIQSWILLRIGTKISIHLISDFLQKLMKLPIGFFDSRNTGDILQRINDHKRIESFLTQTFVSLLLSSLSLVVFGIVLAFYSLNIFFIFLLSSVIYIFWIRLFLKKRKSIDYVAFQNMSDNQNYLIEIVQGMTEIKLQGSHFKRRQAWASIQAQLFNTQLKSLAIAQYQDIGGQSINQLKDIFITFLAAKSVIDGQMTLGMMLAVQFIIGQLNGPLQQLIIFIRATQDARISYDRISEVYEQEDEQSSMENQLKEIPEGNIIIENLGFQYTPITKFVLSNINLVIPRGKMTAIVGASGSGKTTLIKLLLGFYNPTKGNIKIGSTLLGSLNKNTWRLNCGVVMQDGYIFSDSIANNIAESENNISLDKLQFAVNTANIKDFIESLPLSSNTMIGAKGVGISQGQKQRILIARAIYKNPDFIFLDEATNALDAINEGVIIENLNKFFEGRTVVVVAHRLSTVKNADQIIVLDKGEIVEIGDHINLIKMKGLYHNLIKNQLELDM